MNNPKLLSFDCQWAKNEPRNAVNSAFLGSCTLFKLVAESHTLTLFVYKPCDVVFVLF